MSPNGRSRGDFRRGQGPGRSGGGQNITPAPRVEFFKDSEKKKLNPDLLDSIAEAQADKIHRNINSAQLRRFFGEVKGLYSRLEHQEPFERLFPLIKMIKSKVWYAANPNKEKIPKDFASFILGGIEQIKDENDFRAFVLYFEAVVGFMYGKGLVSK